MAARLLILALLVFLTQQGHAQTDDAKVQRQLNARLQAMQRTGNYGRVAELYVELANVSPPQSAMNSLVNAGRNYMYAYRYKRQDSRYLTLARQPLRRAIELCAQMKPQARKNLRYSLRQAYDVLADIALSAGRPDVMLRSQERYLETPGLDASFKQQGRVRVGVARILLGDQAAIPAVAKAIKERSTLRYQLQNVATDLIRQAQVLSKRPGAVALAQERALRRRAAQLILLWERGYERRHFNLWNYRWAGEALLDGGEPAEALRLLQEMGTRITKKPLNGARGNWWQNQRVDEARAQHARALLVLGRPRQAWVILQRLAEQAYLAEPGGDVVERGRWLGRTRRPDGRGVTRLEIDGRVVRYVDLQIYPGGLVSSVRSDLFGRHRPDQVRIINRPMTSRYAVVEGLADAGLRLWSQGASWGFVRSRVIPALVRLRALLRRLKPARFRALAGREQQGSSSLAARGWRAELDLAWVRLSVEQAARVPGELHALSLTTPPSPALASELANALSAAAGAAGPSR